MELKFLDSIDAKRWQIIQDYFAEVIGTSVRVVGPLGGPLTNLSNPHNCCIEVISSSPLAFKKCKECLLLNPQPYSKDKLIIDREHFLDTPSNIYYDSCLFRINRIIIPLKLEQNYVCAYILLGPLILGKRSTYSEYFNMSKDLELDINAVIECIENIRVYSFRTIETLVGLFQEVANYILQIGMPRIEKPIPPRQSITEKHSLNFPFYVNKMLQALFETAKDGIGAERGSIMILDEKTNTLTIQIADGIPEQIITDTKLKPGESLAGWVVQEDEVLVIDENFRDRRLLGRLHLPALKASVMVPIKNKHVVCGVLSLSTVEKEHKFTKENINSVIQLTKMVDSVFINLNENTSDALDKNDLCK